MSSRNPFRTPVTTPITMSSHNPFRTPLATPNPTGASASSCVPPSYTSSPPPSFSAPPSYSDAASPDAFLELTPRIRSDRPQLVTHNTGSSHSTPPPLPPRQSSSTPGRPLPPNRPETDDTLPSINGIRESAPPVYSVTPNVGGGVLFAEQGPRRPFQRAPEPLLQLSVPSSQQHQEGQQQHLRPPQPEPPRFAPLPDPSHSRPRRPNSQSSDFAQDFYNSDGATTPRPCAQQQPQQPRYALPPHLLPVVLVQHRRQVEQDQQRLLRVMCCPQPRPRQ